MKKKIMSYYLKTVIFAVIASAIITVTVFFIISSGNNPDGNHPRYLINSIQVEIQKKEKDFFLSEKCSEILDNNNFWLQILDGNNGVVFEHNTPQGIPKAYTTLRLADILSESDRLEGYTVFITGYGESDEYNILLGVPSGNFKKIVYHTQKGMADIIVQFVLTICVISTGIIVLVSYIFSRRVSRPLSLVSEDIKKMSEGNIINKHTVKEEGAFSEIFHQAGLLQMALKENKKARDIWISNISHDIKTPLATIKGYSEILSGCEYDLEKDEINKYAAEILSSSEVIEGLVNDLKMYQKISEGIWKPRKKEMNLYNFLMECISSSKVYISEKSKVNLKCNRDIVVIGDEKLLKRSFVNIISNAFVHNDAPVTVGICVKTNDDGNICININDNGKGMTPGELKYIFERYYRGMGSDKKEGTGLGLSIAKEVINAHGGSIEVSSNKGKGTEFIIILNN